MTQAMIYGPTLQGKGSFDGGNITEQKPIDFGHEGAVVKRVGPLFYWAWAISKEDGSIPLHPHQVFEIMTYVVNGRAEHGDTLGTRSVVGPGGAQVMQTGSGVSHQERFIGPNMEAFQIWFEPEAQEALRRQPTYAQFEHEQFPIVSGDGYVVKTVIGTDAPVELVTDVQMWDVEIEPGKTFQHTIPAGKSLTALAIRGGGELSGMDSSTQSFHNKDFIVMRADHVTDAAFTAVEENLRLILIEVPTEVPYPLYRKR